LKGTFNGFPDMMKTLKPTDKVGEYYVFDIGGNKYRLVATIHFNTQKLFVPTKRRASLIACAAWGTIHRAQAAKRLLPTATKRPQCVLKVQENGPQFAARGCHR
jgi:hypothetical protein